ncbi:hypothetical protein [Arthrobacter sp. 754]|uniref:hypothetical protein n=1 Tax=Arthrobacter sp. 754 TaxID=3156315 RepID=UPI0033956A23
MSENRTARRGGWPGTVLWGLLVIAAVVLIAIGLRSALFFGYMPEPSQVKDLETGSLYIFAGSAVSLGAAPWSALRGDPFWVTA